MNEGGRLLEICVANLHLCLCLYSNLPFSHVKDLSIYIFKRSTCALFWFQPPLLWFQHKCDVLIIILVLNIWHGLNQRAGWRKINLLCKIHSSKLVKCSRLSSSIIHELNFAKCTRLVMPSCTLLTVVVAISLWARVLKDIKQLI